MKEVFQGGLRGGIAPQLSAAGAALISFSTTSPCGGRAAKWKNVAFESPSLRSRMGHSGRVPAPAGTSQFCDRLAESGALSKP